MGAPGPAPAACRWRCCSSCALQAGPLLRGRCGTGQAGGPLGSSSSCPKRIWSCDPGSSLALNLLWCHEGHSLGLGLLALGLSVEIISPTWAVSRWHGEQSPLGLGRGQGVPSPREAAGPGLCCQCPLVMDGAGICRFSTSPAKCSTARVGSHHSKHYFFC